MLIRVIVRKGEMARIEHEVSGACATFSFRNSM
jgi:hypothetical protein